MIVGTRPSGPKEPDTPEKRLSTLRKCIFLIEPGKRRNWVGLVVLAVVVSVLEAVAAVLVLVLLTLITTPGSTSVPIIGDVHRFYDGSDPNRLLVVTSIFVAFFFVVRGAANLLQSYLQNRMAHTAGADLSRRLFAGYLAMPYVIHVRRNSSELIRNAQESTQAFAQQVLFPASTLMSEALMSLAIFCVLVLTAPATTALAIAVLGPPVLILLKVTQPRLHSLGHRGLEMMGKTLKSLQQTLQGLRDIRVLGREPFFEREFSSRRTELARAFYLRAVLVDMPRLVLETGLILFIVLFIVVNVGLDHSIAGALSSLGLFGYAALRLLPSLNRIMNSVQSLRFGLPFINTLHDEAKIADAYVKGQRVSSRDAISFEDRITLDGVCFRYGETRSEALTDVTLTIRRGEWLGIVGPTGGGKSTLVDIILCLLEPTSGTVRIDGKDGRECAIGWQRHIGVVPQHVFLLDDTIRRNIAFGIADDEIDDVDLAGAVRMAQLEEFVESLPDGLETMVGERGVQLSGGQRQRVAIARALYRRPDVVVFDEGTSALDNRTEANLINAMEQLRGERTLLTVAHRLTTVRACDRVVLVSGGRIVDVGSFDDLVTRNSEFRAMAR